MRLIYWLCAILLPFLLVDIFTRCVKRQYDRMDVEIVERLPRLGFPDDASDVKAQFGSISRRASIYFSLLFPCALALRLLPTVGRILRFLSSLFLLLGCFTQYMGLSVAKRARRSAKLRRFYDPIVRVYRAQFVYALLIMTIFHLFFDLVFPS